MQHYRYALWKMWAMHIVYRMFGLPGLPLQPKILISFGTITHEKQIQFAVWVQSPDKVRRFQNWVRMVQANIYMTHRYFGCQFVVFKVAWKQIVMPCFIQSWSQGHKTRTSCFRSAIQSTKFAPKSFSNRASLGLTYLSPIVFLLVGSSYL